MFTLEETQRAQKCFQKQIMEVGNVGFGYRNRSEANGNNFTIEEDIFHTNSREECL